MSRFFNLTMLPAWCVLLISCRFWGEIPLVLNSFFILTPLIKILFFPKLQNIKNRFLFYTLFIMALILVFAHANTVSKIVLFTSVFMVINSFKLFDLKQIRDIHILIFSLMFSLSSAMLMIQTTAMFLTSLTLFFSMIYYLFCQHPERESLSFKSLILVLPLGLLSGLLFLIFPRLNYHFSPLMMAKSGIENETKLHFEQLSSLNLSEEDIFRAQFSATPPALEQLYWRQAILNTQDGQNWKQTLVPSLGRQRPLDPLIGPRHYRIEILKKDLTRLPNLEYTVFIESGRKDLTLLKDHTLYPALNNQGELLTFKGQAMLALPLEKLTHEEQKKYLNFSQKSIDWAVLPLDFKTAMASPLAHKIQLIQNFFTQTRFTYTLNPPTGQSLNDFLFRSRQGYCTHYALSTALLLRFLKTPTRLVMGYLGAELNPYGAYYIIKAKDAHAWIEAYDQNNNRWIRIDPTQWIFPERLQLGVTAYQKIIDAHYRLGPFKIPRYQFLQSAFLTLTHAQLYSDAIRQKAEYWMQEYDRQGQQTFLAWLKIWIQDSWRFLLLLSALSFLFIVLARYAYYNFFFSPAFSATKALKQRLQKNNLTIDLSDGPTELLQKALLKWPQHQKLLQEIHHLTLQLDYAKPLDMINRKNLIKRLKFQLALLK